MAGWWYTFIWTFGNCPASSEVFSDAQKVEAGKGSCTLFYWHSLISTPDISFYHLALLRICLWEDDINIPSQANREPDFTVCSFVTNLFSDVKLNRTLHMKTCNILMLALLYEGSFKYFHISQNYMYNKLQKHVTTFCNYFPSMILFSLIFINFLHFSSDFACQPIASWCPAHLCWGVQLYSGVLRNISLCCQAIWALHHIIAISNSFFC